MRIIVDKATGNLIEMQSDARPGTLTANALEAGYDAKEVEERAVSAEEYRALFPPPPRPPDDPPVTFSRLAAVLLEAGISKERVDAAIDSARLIQGKG